MEVRQKISALWLAVEDNRSWGVVENGVFWREAVQPWIVLECLLCC